MFGNKLPVDEGDYCVVAWEHVEEELCFYVFVESDYMLLWG